VKIRGGQLRQIDIDVHGVVHIDIDLHSPMQVDFDLRSWLPSIFSFSRK